MAGLVIALATTGVAIAISTIRIRRWEKDTSNLKACLANAAHDSESVAEEPQTGIDWAAVADRAPLIVVKYLRYTICNERRHAPTHATFRQEGMFLMKPTSADAQDVNSAKWSRFTAVQRFSLATTHHAPNHQATAAACACATAISDGASSAHGADDGSGVGMLWEARIALSRHPLLAFMGVRVADAYVRGAGSMRVRLGPCNMVSMVGTREVTQGALSRYLAESAWFPHALLPRGPATTAAASAAATAHTTGAEAAIEMPDSGSADVSVSGAVSSKLERKAGYSATDGAKRANGACNSLHWTALPDDERGRPRARATLIDCGTTVHLDFTFTAEGVPLFAETLRWKAQPGGASGSMKPKPWLVRFDDWTTLEHEGVRIPMTGSAAWVLADGTEQRYCLVEHKNVGYQL